MKITWLSSHADFTKCKTSVHCICSLLVYLQRISNTTICYPTWCPGTFLNLYSPLLHFAAIRDKHWYKGRLGHISASPSIICLEPQACFLSFPSLSSPHCQLIIDLKFSLVRKWNEEKRTYWWSRVYGTLYAWLSMGFCVSGMPYWAIIN